MFVKLFFGVALGVSMSSFAGSKGGFKSAVDFTQKNQSVTNAGQQSQLKSRVSNKQQNQTASQQDSNASQKPSMIDYCRKHTC